MLHCRRFVLRSKTGRELSAKGTRRTERMQRDQEKFGIVKTGRIEMYSMARSGKVLWSVTKQILGDCLCRKRVDLYLMLHYIQN